ncbi:potassium channel beta subunit family protein [Candidatus Pollutiaquabacter sp.]|uniref:potassium channel beta subunit family protein n=1 Tax=Candidatus Pollutiaquabacter sp. TaxID=3416354 RepID=UPI003BF69B14|nr:aldo/keto reductase [Bacteroidota bacterium]
MEYRKLGRSGLQVSALSLGSWLTFGKQIGDEVAEQLMHAAYDAGVNFFDNAEIYARGQSEIVMGNILARSGWDRSSYLVSSKAYFGTEGAKSKPNQRGLSRKHLVEACEAALRRLQVDYLDLYFCHRPDKQTPIEETVWTMHQLVLQGKILYWGTSEWDASEIMEAMLVAERHHLIAPVMEQPQYNLLTRGKLEREYLHLFRYHGIGTTIWSPLASGVLSGKYLGASDEDTRLKMKGLEWLREQVLREEVMTKVKALKSLAEECETTLPLLSIAWCLKNPHVSTVILGASRLSQLQENLGALDVVPRLTQERMDRIDQIFPKPILPEY